MPGILTKTEERATMLANLRLAGSDDAIYTIDELIKRRASEYGDNPLLCFPREGPIDYEEHSARAIDRYVDAAVAALQRRGLGPAVGGNELNWEVTSDHNNRTHGLHRHQPLQSSPLLLWSSSSLSSD
jgi:hypothetical protein